MEDKKDKLEEELQENLERDESTDEITIENSEENQEEITEESKEVESVDIEEYNSLKDSFIRLQADFINYKRRAESEKSEYLEMGTRKVLTDLLTIVDNFERALENKEVDEKFYEGINLIYKQFIDLMNKYGVSEIEAVDEKFNPEIHHAVLVEERENTEPDVVIEVLQKGYLIGEKLLRPAMVKVSK